MSTDYSRSNWLIGFSLITYVPVAVLIGLSVGYSQMLIPAIATTSLTTVLVIGTIARSPYEREFKSLYITELIIAAIVEFSFELLHWLYSLEIFKRIASINVELMLVIMLSVITRTIATIPIGVVSIIVGELTGWYSILVQVGILQLLTIITSIIRGVCGMSPYWLAVSIGVILVLPPAALLTVDIPSATIAAQMMTKFAAQTLAVIADEYAN